MKIDEIKLFYEYNFWADRRILATCAKVSDEQYIASTSFGSLRTILVHIVDAAWGWRLRFQSLNPDQEITEADLPTRAALEERWQAEEQEMRSYLGKLSDQDMDSMVRYPIDSGIVRERPLWHCLWHLVNHGTQHRSEAAALLTSYGQSPGDLDFPVFLNEYLNLPS